LPTDGHRWEITIPALSGVHGKNVITDPQARKLMTKEMLDWLNYGRPEKELGFFNREQELSYRKQIARQLRTHYVESIYRPKYYMDLEI